MINKALIPLSYTDGDKFYNKHVCRACALGKSHTEKAHNKCRAKCTVKGGRWCANLTESSNDSINRYRKV